MGQVTFLIYSFELNLSFNKYFKGPTKLPATALILVKELTTNKAFGFLLLAKYIAGEVPILLPKI